MMALSNGCLRSIWCLQTRRAAHEMLPAHARGELASLHESALAHARTILLQITRAYFAASPLLHLQGQVGRGLPLVYYNACAQSLICPP
jgi:hypothetical protein